MEIINIILIAIVILILFWLFGMKLIIKFMKKGSTPCPSSISWIVDLPVRKSYMRPVLSRAGLQAGETVLELGPGPGAFTVDAARLLGKKGKLITVDIQKEMIDQLLERVQQAGIENVEAHIASAYELPLEDASVDRVFMVTVLPEIPDPVLGLKEVYRVLKPGGVFSTTEEFLDPDYPLRKTTIKWAEQANFRLIERFGNAFLYTLNFIKD